MYRAETLGETLSLVRSEPFYQTERIFDRGSSRSDMAHVAAKRDISSAESEALSHDAKRAKPDDKDGEEGEKESEWENVLSTFTTSSVLSDSAREKIMFVHGKVLLSLFL